VLLTKTAVTDACVKDYAVIEGAGPARWPERFDVTNWGLIWCAGMARGSAVR
jgi:hypothetical protein